MKRIFNILLKYEPDNKLGKKYIFGLIYIDITGSRSNMVKIIGTVLIILTIITYIGSKSKRYMEG